MAEYIEREKLLSDVDAAMENTGMGYVIGQTMKRYIKRVPSADVAPVRHGRWDSSGKYRFQKDNSVAVRCTECGSSLTESEYRCYVWNYCPVCGAKMDLEE